MIHIIDNPVISTYIFIILFCIGLIISIRYKKNEEGLSLAVSQELKGLAILTVIFAHIGYFLIQDHRFLFPLSVLAGVGVDLFLFLSGYGLTISQSKKNENPIRFYKRKLMGIAIPFWFVLILFLITDFSILHIVYPLGTSMFSFLGIFMQADMYTNIDSPFWYLTLILFYYILFPILFIKKRSYITALLFYFLVIIFIQIHPSQFNGVVGLYEVHSVAFPLGILYAFFTSSVQIEQFTFVKNILKFIHNKYVTYLLQFILVGSIFYFSIHSGVGTTVLHEQTISILLMFLFVVLFCLKKIEFKLFTLFGLYSYEIYLFHWPILYRYDFLYSRMSGWLATTLYLGLFIILGYILKKMVQKINIL